MKIIAVNGSPRKNWNTDTLLKNVLDGAASAGAETEMVCLYDLKFLRLQKLHGVQVEKGTAPEPLYLAR